MMGDASQLRENHRRRRVLDGEKVERFMRSHRLVVLPCSERASAVWLSPTGQGKVELR
jgi:hypothetical protein